MLNDFIQKRIEFFKENKYLSEGDFRRFFSGHRGASMLPSDDLNALSSVSAFYKVHSELLANRINERGEINPLTEAELITLHTHLSAIRAEIGAHLHNIDIPNPDVKTWLTDAFMFRLTTELATSNVNDDEKSNSVKKALLTTYQQMGAAGYKDNAEAGIKAWHQTFHDELFNGPGGLMPDFIIANSLQAIFSQKIGMREAHLVPEIQKQLERMGEVLLDRPQQKILQIDAYKQIAELSNIFVDLEKGDTNSYQQFVTTHLLKLSEDASAEQKQTFKDGLDKITDHLKAIASFTYPKDKSDKKAGVLAAIDTVNTELSPNIRNSPGIEKM